MRFRMLAPVGLIVLSLGSNAFAHNYSVHRDMPELAYELMKGVAWDYHRQKEDANPPQYGPPGAQESLPALSTVLDGAGKPR